MKKICFTLCLMLIVSYLISVPAYPGLIRFKQPDGKELDIYLKGDERVNWAETPDGYTMLFNGKGFYEYAELDEYGDLIPSGVAASDEAARSNEEQFLVSRTPKGLRYSRSQVDLMIQVWNAKERHTRAFPTIGNRRLICLLIGFQDLPFTKTQSQFDNLFNQIGYSPTTTGGSVREHFLESSYGQLDLLTDVAGPFMAANNMAYYGDRGGELCTEAINAADPTVDFSLYDNDGDGWVDGVYMIHAGYGKHAGGPEGSIWAHAGSLPQVLLKDGVQISRYATSCELRYSNGNQISDPGIICHEFGHVLGAPDYYDVNYAVGGQYPGLGDWCLMADGCWNDYGDYPAHINGFAKVHHYNWASFNLLDSPSVVLMNNSTEHSDSFYRYNTTTPNEYFILENRRKIGFDAHIPGEGLLIYHVHSDYASAGNSINATHPQKMYLVSQNATSDPTSSPASYGVINAASAAWPGS
ncbi:MAG: M6 family metalloprotease domain-containing protein, partial [Candidatus Cloacimonadaceae bacterium]|nr:M6 family metalloprotease domain-containing protein [Candidatus Cloacimonadaceae bacterium]